MAPILTPLHYPFYHPEAVTCWQDYLGLGNDLILLGIMAGMAYAQWLHLTKQEKDYDYVCWLRHNRKRDN